MIERLSIGYGHPEFDKNAPGWKQIQVIFNGDILAQFFGPMAKIHAGMFIDAMEHDNA